MRLTRHRFAQSAVTLAYLCWIATFLNAAYDDPIGRPWIKVTLLVIGFLGVLLAPRVFRRPHANGDDAANERATP